MKAAAALEANTAPILVQLQNQQPEERQVSVERFLGSVAQSVDAGTVEPPTLSNISQRVQRLKKDAEGQLEALLRITESEPAVAAHVMRLASTTTLPGHRPAQHLRAAMVQLGAPAVTNVVEAVALSDFSRHGRELSFHHLRKIWTCTVYTALAARTIASWNGRVDPEVAFLCGLLHRVGEPLLLRLIGESAPAEAMPFASDPFVLDIIAEHHAQVGSRFLRAWGLPESLVALARETASTPRPDAPLHAVVTAAYQGALHYGYTYLSARPNRGTFELAARAAGVDPDQVEEVMSTIGGRLNELLSMTR